MALEGAIVTGLCKLNVFVRMILKKDDVEFFNCRNVPPCDTAVVEGNVTALNPEFVMNTYEF